MFPKVPQSSLGILRVPQLPPPLGPPPLKNPIKKESGLRSDGRFFCQPCKSLIKSPQPWKTWAISLRNTLGIISFFTTSKKNKEEKKTKANKKKRLSLQVYPWKRSFTLDVFSAKCWNSCHLSWGVKESPNFFGALPPSYLQRSGPPDHVRWVPRSAARQGLGDFFVRCYSRFFPGRFSFTLMDLSLPRVLRVLTN